MKPSRLCAELCATWLYVSHGCIHHRSAGSLGYRRAGFVRWLHVVTGLVVALLFVGLQTACTNTRAPVSPSAAVTLAGGATLTQSGDAQKPGTLSSNTEKATETKRLPLPAGTELVFNEKLGTLTLRLSQTTTLEATATREVKIEHAEAPQAFTPPAPPTPSEEADGKAQWLYRIGLVAGIAAALFGLVRAWDWVMYGGAAVAAGCAVGLFAAKHPAIFAVIGGGIVLAVAGPWIWHTKLKHLETP